MGQTDDLPKGHLRPYGLRFVSRKWSAR